MIIWRGAGFLVFVITFGCSLVAQLLTNHLSGTETYWQAHAWPFAAAMVAAGAIVGVVGRVLSTRTGKVLVDPATGEQHRVGGDHDLFFIPMKYWGTILLAIALAVVVFDAKPGPPRARAATTPASGAN